MSQSKHIPQIIPESPDLEPVEELEEVRSIDLVDRRTYESIRVLPSDQRIELRSIVLEESIVHENALMGSILIDSTIKDCVFERADLANITWSDAKLIRVRFDQSRLTGADLRLGELRDVRFNECKAPDMLLSESSIKQTCFDSCQIQNLDLSGARIESLAIHRSELGQLRLDGARINLLDLRGSTLDSISLDPGSVRGLVIDPLQAPVIASSLGIRVQNLI